MSLSTKEKRSLTPFLFLMVLSFTTFGQFKLVKENENVSVVYHFNANTDNGNQLKVYLEDSETSILGSLQKAEKQVVFKPLLPFKADINYIAVFGEEKYTFHLMGEPKGNLEVTTIYPTADTLPSNLLKVYIQFSEPIGQGQAYKAIQLYDEHDEIMPVAFVNLGIELWDEANSRLTLWLDPGRIKRDLLRNQMEGEVLHVGKSYSIKIDQNIKSLSGNSLTSPYVKHFVTEKADRIKPRIADWKVKATPSLLKIDFPEVMDYATALKMFEVLDASQATIKGAWSLSKGEEELSFSPNSDFPKGGYQLKINTLIEDWAANNLNAPFDRDIRKEERSDAEYEYLEFSVR